MMKDFYVDQYKEEFIGLYDRNSEEFRKDLDRLIKVSYAAGATAEKYRIIEKFKDGEIMVTVSDLPDVKYQKLITTKIADSVRAML